MTRRDYIEIAQALARAQPPRDNADMLMAHNRCCQAVCDMLSERSKGFDQDAFMMNCKAPYWFGK